MKKLLLLVIIALSTQTIKAQADAFITTWVTTTGFETITLAKQFSAPNYTIDWGDGSATNTYTATQTPSHTYINSGEHTVSFTGTFPRLTFVAQTKLKAVQQWGTQKWTSMANMFQNCNTFNNFPTQAPDLSLCTDMSQMFSGATAFDQPIDSWNVGNVTNMSGMFAYATAFNQPIGSWNMSNVIYMGSMFGKTKLSTTNYDNLLIGWAMQGANGGLLQQKVEFSGGNSNYCNASGARDYLINTYGWQITDAGFDCTVQDVVLDTNGVTIKWTGNTVPTSRFVQASPRGTLEWFAIVDDNTKSNITDYAKNIQSGIDYFTPTGSSTPIPFNNIVTTLVTDMNGMFYNFSYYYYFNQPLDSWDVSNVTNMMSIFSGATAFNQPIGSWNVSNVTDMSGMFYGATNFNQPIGSWNVSKVTDMAYMFFYTPFNQPIGNWNVSKVTDMRSMFAVASAFNQNIVNWNVSSVTNMAQMFWNATVFNQPIDSWNVSKVTNMLGMFFYTPFNQPIGNWNVSNVTNMNEMFFGTKLSTANYDTTLIGWATRGTNGGVLKTNVSFSGGNSKYCNGLAARNYLTNTYGWVITDGGLDCSSLDTEDFNTNSLKLYPNPVLSVLNVDNNLINQPYNIIDTLGKVILKGKLNEGDNSINVEQLSKGIYYLKVANNKTSKFIKE